MIFVEPLEKLFGLTFDCYLGDVKNRFPKNPKILGFHRSSWLGRNDRNAWPKQLQRPEGERLGTSISLVILQVAIQSGSVVDDLP